MKKILILFKTLALYALFFGVNIGMEKNIICAEVKTIIEEDIKSAMCYSLRFVNHEIVINKEIFIYKLKEILQLSLKHYSFEQKNIKVGYIYDDLNIKGVQICLKYQKNLIMDKITLQYMIHYLA